MRHPKVLCAIIALSVTSIAWGGDGIIYRVGKPVPNRYIVILEPTTADVTLATARLLQTYGGQAITTYTLLFKGFAASMNETQASSLSHDPLVQRVEEDGIMDLATTQPIPSIQIYNPPPTTQSTLWGLDRIDQPSATAYRFDYSYSYCSDGTGVRAYIVDTGVLPGHAEFGNRVDPAPNLSSYLTAAGMGLGSQCWTLSSGGFSANNAHGTAVASVLGGATAGVAKNVTIVDARALDCDEPRSQNMVSRFNKVLEWIPQDPNRGTAQRVVNISSTMEVFWDPTGSSMAQSIATLVDTYNIPVVVAAGNYNNNVYWYIPADAGGAITVAGSNKGSDDRWSQSNYGNTTAFYAPAQFIEAASTTARVLFPSLNGGTRDTWRSELQDCTSGNCSIWPHGTCHNDGDCASQGQGTCNLNYPYDTCTSGTSFSSPIVAGIVARYLQNHPGATHAQIVSALQAQAKVYVNDPLLGPVPLVNFTDCP